MYMKIHEKGGQKVVAACDADLLGKVFGEGGITLDLNAYSSFYKGELCGEGALLSAIPPASSINLVGKKSVAAGLRSGLFSEQEVKYINGIPHIQVYRV